MIDLDENEKKIIMGKLEKILAHAGDGAVNDNEIKTANKLAKTIMDKYGITMAEITNCDDKTQLIFEEEISRSGFSRKKWVSLLSGVLAKFYECNALQNGLSFSFIGYRVDTMIAAKMFKETYKKIYNQSKNVIGVSSGDTIRRRKNYCIGAVMGLQEKLYVVTNERLKIQNALVVLKKDKVDDYMNEKFPELKSAKSCSVSYTPEYMQGKSFGKTIGISEEIKNKQ